MDIAVVPQSSIDSFEQIINKISLERSLIQVGSDAGLIPVFSLLTEGYEAMESCGVIQDGITKAMVIMEGLLDDAAPFDSYSEACVDVFIYWAQESIAKLMSGKEADELTFPDASGPSVALSDVTIEVESDQEEDQLLVIDPSMDKEVLDEFITESIEHLEQIEGALLELEENPQDGDALAAIFRSFHTIKGGSGFLKLFPIQALAHEVESLLDLARNGQVVLCSNAVKIILESRDIIHSLVGQVEKLALSGEVPSEVIPISAKVRQVQCLINQEPLTEGEVQDKSPKAKEISRKSNTSTIRVNTQKLDNLMNAVGELVIVESQLESSTEQSLLGNAPLQVNLSQLKRITKELQHTSMSLRMVSIKPTFQKVNRLVKELEKVTLKQVNIHISGEDTELDRNVVEEIADPLLHMVRNSLDHGIESPEERKEKGKPEVGNFHIKAYHRGSSMVIEIQDDGRGINHHKILDKARSQSLASDEVDYSPSDIYQFLFMPGFSTAEKVTDLSGRGVGMDVVKQNITKLRGSIEVESEIDKGTTFRINLPLTMAIVDGLIVQVAQDRFILPSTMVKVAIRATVDQLSRIQGGSEVVNIRGEVIPVVRLHEKFGIEGAVSQLEDGIIVIIESSGRPYGLFVDAMIGKQEVVIKSLGSLIQNIEGIAGGAILGDGSIALILDTSTLSAKG